jgi:signal transduction histidine kinase/ligand-binding sensor domain-containing protein
MNVVKYIFIFFCLCPIGILFAQQPSAKYKRCSAKTLNYEQGLLNNATTDVITDANGFTWFSTVIGMQRYNGYNFEQINPVVDGKILAINSPVHFFELDNKNIWISCPQGVLEYCASTNTFKKIISSTISPDVDYAIIPVYQTGVEIYCFQKEKGIVVYNKDGKFIKQVFNVAKKLDSLVYTGQFLFNSPTTKNNNYFFILGSGKLIMRLDIKNKRWDDFVFNDDLLSITCTENKLFILSTSALSFVLLSKMNEHHLTPGKSIKMNTSSGRLILGNKNQLLVGNANRLLEFDTSLSEKKEFITLARKPVVSTGFIHHIYTDTFGRIWLLTNDDVKRIENAPVTFENFIYPNEGDNFIRSIYYDLQKHLLLAGGYEGLIQLYDTLANPLWPKPLSEAEAGYILSIQKLTGNNYLLLTENKGLCYLNLLSKKIIPYEINKNKLPDLNFDNIMQKINDSCFYYTTTKAFRKCIIIKNKISSDTSLFSFDNSKGQLTSFIYTSEKRLWVGTTNGYIYFRDEKNKITNLHIPQNYIIRCFAETADKSIWVGTDKGLYIFAGNGKLKKIITRQSGLLNDCIYALLPHETNSVFASTNLGLSYINETGAIKNFSKELGLQESEFNTSSAIKTASGKFYFGGVNGISAFYPASFSSLRDKPILNLTRFIVNDSEINANFDTIELKYFQNRLQFDVAALGLLNNNEYFYRYHLLGFDDTWQTTHSPTGIKYNLSPGTYTLQIVCSPALFSGNVFKKNFVIIIKSPWWKSWWFLSFVAIVVIGAVSLIITEYNRRKYIQKIRSLEMQNQIQLERERISRELHDNIGSQISFISSISDWLIDKRLQMNKDEELQQIIGINNTAKNVMMNLRETIWTLQKEEITIQEFFDKFKAYVISILQLRPGIEFKAEENIDTNFILTPTETLNIFRICQECLNNVLKHAEATLIKIFIYSDDKLFKILIEDNGIGFDTEKKLNEHFGLANMKYRAEDLKANILIQSAEGRGTIIGISKNQI